VGSPDAVLRRIIRAVEDRRGRGRRGGGAG